MQDFFSKEVSINRDPGCASYRHRIRNKMLAVTLGEELLDRLTDPVKREKVIGRIARSLEEVTRLFDEYQNYKQTLRRKDHGNK